MSRAMTLAADLVAKCVAKGTWGGVYVPREVARAAFPKADAAVYDEAVGILDAAGFLVWHKGGSCYGLNPAMSREVYDFAVANASAKRAATLALRGPPRVVEGTLVAPVEALDAEDEVDLSAYVSRRELDLFRQEVIRSIGAAGAAAGHDPRVDALLSDVARLRGEVERLKSFEDLARGAHTYAQGIEAHLERLNGDVAKWRQLFLDVEEQLKKRHAVEAKVRDAAESALNLCPCGAVGAVSVPFYRAEGGRWVRRGEFALCAEDGASAGYVVDLPDSRSAAYADRLARTAPKHGKPPFILTPANQALGSRIFRAFVQHGVMPPNSTAGEFNTNGTSEEAHLR